MEVKKALSVFKFTIGVSREGEGKMTEKVNDNFWEEDFSSDEENLAGTFESFVPSKDIDQEDEYFVKMNEKLKEALHELVIKV